jgi:hypothetical protein
MFALRWRNGNRCSAYKYLQQAKDILASPIDITSGEQAVVQLTSIGVTGAALIDDALRGFAQHPHHMDSQDEEKENVRNLFLWAVLWEEVCACAY